MRSWLLGLICSLSVAVALASDKKKDDGDWVIPPPPAPKIDSLIVWPETLVIEDGWNERHVLVTGVTKDGARYDLTSQAQFKPKGKLVEILPGGVIRGKEAGVTEIEIKAGGKKAKLKAEVKSADVPKIRFVRDVMPVLTRLGCNAGTCHGALNGKNGFKLSLRGYDPEYDYNALVREISGRRINRVMPDQSLMLLKPAGLVAHEGRALFAPGSQEHQLLLNWISEGVTTEEAAAGRAVKLEVFPEKIDFDLPGRTQQIVVLAHHPDGVIRDVTRNSSFSTSNKDVAAIDAKGMLSSIRRGEAAILIRYEGNYAARELTVMGDRKGFEFVEMPLHNYIDEHVQNKWKRMQILPSELCTDADFIRRVSLDLTGMPPTPERARAFVEDKTPSKEKRDKLVDELVGSNDYIEFWSNKWADLLQCHGKTLGEKSLWLYRDWIRQSIAQNKPYDQFVRELLTANGSSFKNPAVNYFRVLREPSKITEDVSQTFLGTRFNCNKCHDHPFERWTQNQYYEFGAYFARVAFKKGDLPAEEIVYRNFHGGEVSHPKNNAVVAPKVPFGQAQDAAKVDDRRDAFIDWMTSKENPLFATSMANRMWSYFFGIGIIDPVDDIRAGNPPSNLELLTALTDDFVKSGFDLRHLHRTIAKSRTYQLSVKTNPWNADDQVNFSHAKARRLTAEQLFDSVAAATGVRPRFSGLPLDLRAATAPDGMVPGADFLQLFGRPERLSSCECERTSNISLSHTLNLINGTLIGDAINAPGNRIAKIVEANPDNKKVIDEIYYAIFSRPATETELNQVDLGTGATRLEVAQDLAWALLNSPAFIFNR